MGIREGVKSNWLDVGKCGGHFFSRPCVPAMPRLARVNFFFLSFNEKDGGEGMMTMVVKKSEKAIK